MLKYFYIPSISSVCSCGIIISIHCQIWLIKQNLKSISFLLKTQEFQNNFILTTLFQHTHHFFSQWFLISFFLTHKLGVTKISILYKLFLCRHFCVFFIISLNSFSLFVYYLFLQLRPFTLFFPVNIVLISEVLLIVCSTSFY